MTKQGSIKPDRMNNVTVRMPDHMRLALQAHAINTRRTFSDYVRLVLNQHLDDKELS